MGHATPGRQGPGPSGENKQFRSNNPSVNLKTNHICVPQQEEWLHADPAITECFAVLPHEVYTLKMSCVALVVVGVGPLSPCQLLRLGCGPRVPLTNRPLGPNFDKEVDVVALTERWLCQSKPKS
mmetsp:Transcript_14262/g.43810  ORF Transcript_14262/g.43810 Transcript_14262/m.43810 type:complete len:125 (-) Transcript_14262:1992-2366(-)|eukprot:scaffold112489_cov27-Tisochrysis_lutea.AAC.1